MKNIDKGIKLTGRTAEDLSENACPREFDISTEGCRENDCYLCWEEEYKGTVREAMLQGGKFDKFTVIKNEDVRKYLGAEGKAALIQAANEIEAGRLREGRDTKNTYLVINTDEPYAAEVIEILKSNGHWG